MKSIIAEKIGMKYNPVAFLRTDWKPENAVQPKAGARGGCVMSYFAQAAVNGKTAVFDCDTYICAGAKAGLCFGSGYGTANECKEEFFAAFFTKGADAAKDKEKYMAIVERMPKASQRKMIEGERMYPSFDAAYKAVMDEKRFCNFDAEYAVYIPLSDLPEDQTPKSVIFTVNPIQITALMHVLKALGGQYKTQASNYSGCQSIGSEVVTLERDGSPKAVLGLTDLAARAYVRNIIPDDCLTFAVPWKMFLEMEAAVNDSVLETVIWEKIAQHGGQN